MRRANQLVVRASLENLSGRVSKRFHPWTKTARHFSAEPFLNGESSPYFHRMYEHWSEDPSSVHASWDAYFRNLAANVDGSQAFVTPPPFDPSKPICRPSDANLQSVFDTSRVIELVRGYQSRGHEFASIDPLKLPDDSPFVSAPRRDARRRPIDYKSYGFTEKDLDRRFDCRVPGVTGFLSPDRPQTTLRELVQRLEETYCGNIGIEASHIEDPNVTNYLRQVLESEKKFEFSPEVKKQILIRTARAQLFEQFCALKFNTSKRFGVDGCEGAIVILKGIAKKAVQLGIESIVMGMPHRGRLNTLVNVMHKPMEAMMREFQGITGFGGNSEWGNSGDVKYHLGVSNSHFDEDEKKMIHMTLLANPSHLEAVDPLVIGRARAQQYYSKDTERARVLPILLHGDASFAGQGVVYETLQMSKLPNYHVGGTIHMIVNNQIGFTTDVVDQGSGRYCSDLAKFIDAPVLHVNADDPEACTQVALIALDYRQKFKSNIFINLVGYRRFGHNELDMPKFTQPSMYNIVASHPPVFEKYSKKLIDEGVVDSAFVDDLKKSVSADFTEQYKASQEVPAVTGRPDYLPQWKHMAKPGETCPPRPTGIELGRLKELGMEISQIPERFTPHPTIGKVYKAREEAIETGENVDFGFAEALAFGSLLNDGFHVRLSGQDVQRGTFSHRHAVLTDQTVFTKFCPLADFVERRGLPHKFEVNNSHLSEYAAMGFEVGYSIEHPDTLSIWEAQFGDFANTAQVIIDQFIASGETKWAQQLGVVLSLPHGYDGQGPEHSSARIERFLQLCDDREDVINPDSWDVTKRSVIQRHNFQVVYCSTPANVFHVLRRQVHRGFRKPLVMIVSKRILKMRAAFSRLAEFADDTCFLRYIPNTGTQEVDRPSFVGVERPLPTDESVERLVLCSGQLYYDLAAYREKFGLWNVGIARVEQISPFPYDRVIDDIQRYPNLRDVVWAQEEPMNAGPWNYASKRLVSCLEHLGRPNGISSPVYVGRDVSGSPACGDAKIHTKELETLLADAFDMYRRTNSYLEKYMKTSDGGTTQQPVADNAASASL